jgi:hypothetical protein
MDTILQLSYTSDNRIAFCNATFSIEAQGKSADGIVEAARFALYCAGIALIIKSLR